MDIWIKNKIGLGETDTLTREAIKAYQKKKLVETLKFAKEKSSFYNKHLKNVEPAEITNLSDIEMLPFIDASHIKENNMQMLCVAQDKINRIVTLQTSGTTGKPKRIYFTEEDQELTIDFFHHGMEYIVNKEDVVLILMPCKTPGSIGELLIKGLERLGARSVAYGIPDDFKKVADVMNNERVTSIVGIPVHVLQLAEIYNAAPETHVKSVLLSADYIPDSLSKRLEKIWNCEVFEHYGMTEMGFGGAVSCKYLKGMHTREADLYFEIIDPKTGRLVPDGEFGEIVVTTLTRRGMPLIRYKTGDYGRWLTGQCPCGTVMKSLDKVRHRIADTISVEEHHLNIAQLDELLFQIDGLYDYEAELIKKNGKTKLQISLNFLAHNGNITGNKRRIIKNTMY